VCGRPTTIFYSAFKELILILQVVTHPRADLQAAKKIADAFEVSLDYLVGEGVNSKFDKKTLKRLHDLELLEEEKKKTLYDLMDTYIRDAKARKAYTS
jgi:hypothetical protein